MRCVPLPAELDRNENDATDAATARKFTQQTDTILGLILDPSCRSTLNAGAACGATWGSSWEWASPSQ